MKRGTKLLSLLPALAMVLSLCACGGTGAAGTGGSIGIGKKQASVVPDVVYPTYTSIRMEQGGTLDISGYEDYDWFNFDTYGKHGVFFTYRSGDHYGVAARDLTYSSGAVYTGVEEMNDSNEVTFNDYKYNSRIMVKLDMGDEVNSWQVLDENCSSILSEPCAYAKNLNERYMSVYTAEEETTETSDSVIEYSAYLDRLEISYNDEYNAENTYYKGTIRVYDTAAGAYVPGLEYHQKLGSIDAIGDLIMVKEVTDTMQVFDESGAMVKEFQYTSRGDTFIDFGIGLTPGTDHFIVDTGDSRQLYDSNLNLLYSNDGSALDFAHGSDKYLLSGSYSDGAFRTEIIDRNGNVIVQVPESRTDWSWNCAAYYDSLLLCTDDHYNGSGQYDDDFSYYLYTADGSLVMESHQPTAVYELLNGYITVVIKGDEQVIRKIFYKDGTEYAEFTRIAVSDSWYETPEGTPSYFGNMVWGMADGSDRVVSAHVMETGEDSLVFDEAMRGAWGMCPFVLDATVDSSGCEIKVYETLTGQKIGEFSGYPFASTWHSWKSSENYWFLVKDADIGTSLTAYHIIYE